jgi:hypothetical protein
MPRTTLMAWRLALLSPVTAVPLAGCSPKPVNPDAPPVYEWLCSGRAGDRQVKTRVDASSREEAMAKAKEKFPDMTAPQCTPNPKR